MEQGVFTYALLEGLGVQGRCATVERLDAYLARRVPELNRQYGKRIQTPLTIAEPIDRAHLILVPEYATLSDVTTLKLDAYRAAEEGDRALARQLWIRVLGSSPADLDAITALERLASAVTPEPLPTPRRQTNRRQSKSPRFVSSVDSHRRTQTSPKTPGVTRRQVMQWSLWGSAGLGLAVVGTIFLELSAGQKIRAGEAEGKNLIGAINRAQRAYRLEYPEFAATLEELQIGLPSDTDNYSYAIESQPDSSRSIMVTARAKQEGMRSYTGAAFVLDDGSTAAIGCETDALSMTLCLRVVLGKGILIRYCSQKGYNTKLPLAAKAENSRESP